MHALRRAWYALEPAVRLCADDKVERPYFGAAQMARRSAYARFLRPEQVIAMLPDQEP